MNRNLNADIVKSISIFGVVFIHSAFIFGESNLMFFLRDMFRFSVPCFIIIWAFFLEKSYIKKSREDRKKYILKRFFHLFRVFTIWSLLYFFINVEWNTFELKDIATKYFSGFGWSGQYFFIILFQLLLLYFGLREMYERKFIKWTTLVFLFFIYLIYGYFFDVVPPFIKQLGDRPFILWIPYVFIGIALARKEIKLTSRLFFYTPILIGLEFILLAYLKLEHSYYITLGVLISSSLFCSSFLTGKPINISEKYKSILSFIGDNTLVIFVSNPLVILGFNKLSKTPEITNSLIGLSLSVNIFLNISCAILVFIITLTIAKTIDLLGIKKLLI